MKEIQRLKRDSAEQRDGHEALLGMVRAKRLVADLSGSAPSPDETYYFVAG